MNTHAILKHLHAERERITRAITALESLSSNSAGHRTNHRPKRTLSAAARKRIGRAKKAWWAAKRKQK